MEEFFFLSFFLSYSDPLLPTHCWCRGLLLCFITLSDTHTHTLGKTPLDEGSALRRDLYLTKHNTHNRQTSVPSAGIEPAIPAIERPKTYALEITATGIGNLEERPHCLTR